MKLKFSASATLLSLVLTVGCAHHHHQGIYATYEERYRLLYAKNMVRPDRMDRDPDAASNAYRAAASLNLAFEDLTAEGFQLNKISPISQSGGATKFTFRRLIPEGYKPTRAPMEYTGIYSVQQSEIAEPTYYILDPRPQGYRVNIVTPVGERSFIARYDRQLLNWRTDNIEHTLKLSDDARSIVHTVTPLPPAGERAAHPTSTEAFRIEDKS